MPVVLPWTLVSSGLAYEDSDTLLESYKAFRVYKSELMPYTVCAVVTPHNMRRRVLVCASAACAETASYAPCPCRAKTHACQVLRLVSVWEMSQHVSLVSDPTEPQLTAKMKEAAKEMTRMGLKPARIRNTLLRRFGLTESTLPSLKKIQCFAQHYASTHLGCSDEYEEIRAQIRQAGFRGSENECEPFTFSWRTDADGLPEVGVGSDADPFIVGVMSRRLLRRADRDPRSFVLHADATFKLNQVGYPVFVVGISDRKRAFHLVALFITSQRTQQQYVDMLAALRRVYTSVIGKQLRVRYAMSDAEDAQWAAYQRVLRVDNEVTLLMCYFHVVKNVYERTRRMRPRLAELVLGDVANMHYARDADDLVQTRGRVFASWEDWPELHPFVSYFRSVWLTGQYTTWQAFLTPPGYAATNNPVEHCNRTIKREYTLRARLKIGALLTQLLTCCKSESLTVRGFALSPSPSPSLLRHMRELRRLRCITEQTPSRASLAFVLGGMDDASETDTVRVVARLVPRVCEQGTNRREQLLVTAQMSSGNARMEVEDQPPGGWSVRISTHTCDCRYWSKHGTCVHAALVLSSRGLLVGGSRTKLVYRGPNAAKRLQAIGQDAGRPAYNSNALTRE